MRLKILGGLKSSPAIPNGTSDYMRQILIVIVLMHCIAISVFGAYAAIFLPANLVLSGYFKQASLDIPGGEVTINHFSLHNFDARVFMRNLNPPVHTGVVVPKQGSESSSAAKCALLVRIQSTSNEGHKYFECKHLSRGSGLFSFDGLLPVKWGRNKFKATLNCVNCPPGKYNLLFEVDPYGFGAISGLIFLISAFFTAIFGKVITVVLFVLTFILEIKGMISALRIAKNG